MVKRLPDQPDDQLKQDFTALKSLGSVEIQALETAVPYKIWRCGVNQRQNALGYWIGDSKNYFAYIVVEPIQLAGMSALEVKRAWVEPNCRKKGMHTELLNCAAMQSQSSVLVGDREGMTLDAFNTWNRMSGFEVRYFDLENNAFVLENNIPQQDKFTSWSDGDRWLITLTKKSS